MLKCQECVSSYGRLPLLIKLYILVLHFSLHSVGQAAAIVTAAIHSLKWLGLWKTSVTLNTPGSVSKFARENCDRYQKSQLQLHWGKFQLSGSHFENLSVSVLSGLTN